jgi:hypothetical protein
MHDAPAARSDGPATALLYSWIHFAHKMISLARPATLTRWGHIIALAVAILLASLFQWRQFLKDAVLS